MEALWADDARSAVLLDEGGEYAGRLIIDHWFEPGDPTSRVAWVAEYLDGGELVVVLVDDAHDLPGAEDQARLLRAAERAIAQGPPRLVEPQLPMSAFGEELDLLLYAWQQARERLTHAARRPDEHARALIYVALTETVSWTCTFDDVLRATWGGFRPAFREKVSKEVDRAVARVRSRNRQQTEDRGHPYVEGRHAVFDAYDERQRTGEPYPFWSYLLAINHHDVDPRFLSGMRWIRGKFVHRGVLHAVDLRQWRPGAEPRWKWLPSSLTGQRPDRRDLQQLADYDAIVAGTDVLGSLGLADEFLDAVWLFHRLYHEHLSSPLAAGSP